MQMVILVKYTEQSFNINGVLQKDADIKIFKISVTKAIEHNISSSEENEIQSGPVVPI